jgi:chromosome segregation ATPase
MDVDDHSSVSALQSRVESLLARLSRQEIESEQALTELSSRSTELEIQLEQEREHVRREAEERSKANDEANKLREELQAERQRVQRESGEKQAQRSNLNAAEEERRKLLGVIQRLEAEKANTEGVYLCALLYMDPTC